MSSVSTRTLVHNPMANPLLGSDRLPKRQVHYREFMDQASSGYAAPRVVVKRERPAGELLFQFTFIVTNMTLQPKNVRRLSCQRGHMENVIKEAKNGFAGDKMSRTDFAANTVKRQITMRAHNFNNGFRRLWLPETMKSHRMETLRIKLVNIAGKIVCSGRYWTWKLGRSCVYQKEFIQPLNDLTRFPRLG